MGHFIGKRTAMPALVFRAAQRPVVGQPGHLLDRKTDRAGQMLTASAGILSDFRDRFAAVLSRLVSQVRSPFRRLAIAIEGVQHGHQVAIQE